MKCPECEKEGKKSKVFPGCSFHTDMYYAPFYDADGNLHDHDANAIVTSYSCTNGHNFNIVRRKSCWCGWPEKTGTEEPR